jgi:hypothetical protein
MGVLEIAGVIVSVISTIGLQNILIILGSALILIFTALFVIKGIFSTLADFVKKTDLESVGPVKFDTSDPAPTPKKRRIIRNK